MQKAQHFKTTSTGSSFTFNKTTTTIIFSGILKKFMMVALTSSGMYLPLKVIAHGQNHPTETSKQMKAKNRMYKFAIPEILRMIIAAT